MQNIVSCYWGKAQAAGDNEASWHPLVWHSLDVGAAMSALLSSRPAWVTALSQLTKFPFDEIRKRLILVAMLHDLGKFADNFQAKVPDIYNDIRRSQGSYSDFLGHGDAGAFLWDAWDKEGCSPTHELEGWVQAAFSHHGVPVSREGKSIYDFISPEAQEDALAFTHMVLELVGEPEGSSTEQGQWLVSGLVILADWIGSNQRWFPYEIPKGSITDYWQMAQRRAAKALQEAALQEASAATQMDLEDLLGHSAIPSPLQQWASLQQPQAAGQLYIIEDLTGAGKTEAALLLAHRLMKCGAAEGLYWALPSMATANGLYSRLNSRYRALFAASGETFSQRDPSMPPSLILSHGAADIHDVYQASISQATPLAASQEISAEAFCAAFMAEERKKAFLAQVGVGTLDQALLAALPVRHQSLRLAALARRVLVIDEAHSYDPYMSKGMEALLRFHAAHGGSAIILSATLTQAQCARLIDIYAGPNLQTSLEAKFPLATCATSGAVQQFLLRPARGSRRNLPYRQFTDPTEVMDALLAEAKAGYCAVYIRNTVDDAVRAFEYMSDRASDPSMVEIFHARFTVGDRAKKEEAILKRFGKGGALEERQGRILIATQVIESSLDLDFDFMASDLCPMDLLIQRAGRLQRHQRSEERPEPILWVVAPDMRQPVSADWYARLFPKGQYVYPDVGQLWRTLGVLKANGGLNLASASPRDYIEPVFGENQVETPAALIDGSDAAAAKRQSATAVAALNFLTMQRFDPDVGAWGSDVKTPTRLGEHTVVWRLAHWDGKRLLPWNGSISRIDETSNDIEKAWRLSEIRVRKAIAGELVINDPILRKEIEDLKACWGGRFDSPEILPLSITDQKLSLEKVSVKKGDSFFFPEYSTLKGLQI